MEGLRITYPCISIDFETIVNSLKTVHEDVHWEENLQEKTSSSTVGAEDVRELDMVELRMELACDLCGDVMRCPCTSLVCFHSYCRSCIEEAIEKQRGEKFCPVKGCENASLDGCVPVSLRRQPFWKDHPMIVGDGLLAEMIRKVVRDGREDPDKAEFDSRIPSFIQETGDIEDWGPFRCIRPKQHQQPKKTGDQDSEMEVADQSMDQPIGDLDDPVFMTVAVFPFENEDISEMDDNYFYLPSHMTARQFREYLEARFGLSPMILYSKERCLTDSAYEAMTLGEIYDVCWRPQSQQQDDIFTLRYRLDDTRRTESPL